MAVYFHADQDMAFVREIDERVLTDPLRLLKPHYNMKSLSEGIVSKSKLAKG